MGIDAATHPLAAAAVRGDARAVSGLDSELSFARDSADYAGIDALLVPIVDAAAEGDAEALHFLLRCIDRHRLAQAPIRKILIDEDEVEDAAQNTLMSVSRAIGSFERRSRFTTWLYRVAEREALQVLRRNKRVVEPGGEDFSALADEVRHMSSVVASAEMLRAVLDELDPKLREPVVMCDVEGMEYAAIAEHLGIPINTVRTRIRRGRLAIADRVMSELGITPPGSPSRADPLPEP